MRSITVALAILAFGVSGAHAGPGPKMPDWDTLVDGQTDRLGHMCFFFGKDFGCELIFSRAVIPVTIIVKVEETTTSNIQELHPTRSASVEVMLPSGKVAGASIDFTDGGHFGAERRTTAPCFGQFFPQCPQGSVIYDRDGADVRNVFLKNMAGLIERRALYRHGHMLN
ncbi:hypothetical protein LCGC14_2404360, partial [marine sediment metagenome]